MTDLRLINFAVGNQITYPAEVMRIAGDNDRAGISVYFNSISGNITDDGRNIMHFDADCFVTLK